LLVLEGFASDITKRRQNEAEIEKLALVARETDNAVILADVAGCIEWVNAGSPPHRLHAGRDQRPQARELSPGEGHQS